MSEHMGAESEFDLEKVVATKDDKENGLRAGYIKDPELAKKAAELERERRDNPTKDDEDEALWRSTLSDDLPYSVQDVIGAEANQISTDFIEKDIYQKAFQAYIDSGKTKDEALEFAHEQVENYKKINAKRSQRQAGL